MKKYSLSEKFLDATRNFPQKRQSMSIGELIKEIDPSFVRFETRNLPSLVLCRNTVGSTTRESHLNVTTVIVILLSHKFLISLGTKEFILEKNPTNVKNEGKALLPGQT